MMKQLLKDVEQLTEKEYALASKDHGAQFHSPHEAYAVIKEEVEEAQDELRVIEDRLTDEFWRGVKYDSTFTCNYNAKIIYDRAVSAAAECIQVAAMACKSLKGYEVDKK